jgi:hypothetical protein
MAVTELIYKVVNKFCRNNILAIYTTLSGKTGVTGLKQENVQAAPFYTMSVLEY